MCIRDRYWFDPLVWVAAVVSRRDCELACDEGALQRLGEAERIPYGQTLLRLIPVARRPESPMLSATTMTAGKKELEEIAAEGETVHIGCQFCDADYQFGPEEIQNLLLEI